MRIYECLNQACRDRKQVIRIEPFQIIAYSDNGLPFPALEGPLFVSYPNPVICGLCNQEAFLTETKEN